MTGSTAAAKTTLLKGLGIVSFLVAGMGAGYLFGRYLKTVPDIALRFDSLVWWDLLLVPVGFLLALAVHEAGHLFGGFLRGMRFLLYIVGPLQLTRTASGIQFKWIFNLVTFGGLAAATPDPDRPIKPQLLSLIAGGPLASQALALLGWLAFVFMDGRIAAYGLFIGWVSALIFLATAVPSRAGGFMSDGKQFLEVLGDGEAVMERQRYSTLMAQGIAGVRPRDWDADWLEPASRTIGGDPVRLVAARQMAMLAAQDRGDQATADDHAEWLSEHYADFPMGFRQSLTVELCLHALARGNLNAAKIWMAQSKGGVVDESRRALAEAELAYAEGDRPLALGRQIAARSQLHKGMDAGLSRLTEERLDALMLTLANSRAK